MRAASLALTRSRGGVRVLPDASPSITVRIQDHTPLLSSVPPARKAVALRLTHEIEGERLGDPHIYQLPLELVDIAVEEDGAALPVAPLDLSVAFWGRRSSAKGMEAWEALR